MPWPWACCCQAPCTDVVMQCSPVLPAMRCGARQRPSVLQHNNPSTAAGAAMWHSSVPLPLQCSMSVARAGRIMSCWSCAHGGSQHTLLCALRRRRISPVAVVEVACRPVAAHVGFVACFDQMATPKSDSPGGCLLFRLIIWLICSIRLIVSLNDKCFFRTIGNSQQIRT